MGVGLTKSNRYVEFTLYDVVGESNIVRCMNTITADSPVKKPHEVVLA